MTRSIDQFREDIAKLGQIPLVPLTTGRIEDLPPVERAMAFATRAHAGQLDKAGKPYILHPFAVASDPTLTTDQEIIVALLHDVVEDTDITTVEIRDLFGMDVALSVAAITHLAHEPLKDYCMVVKKDPTALKVKLADVRHNEGRLSCLSKVEQTRLLRKFDETYLYLHPDYPEPEEDDDS